jgi:hypothetical protein
MLDLSSSVSFFVLGFIGWFIYKVYIWPYYLSPLRKIPGPSTSNPFYDSLFAEEVSIVYILSLINLILDLYFFYIFL